MNTLHINLWGGPGTGKSTSAAGLFYEMKSQGDKVELITEFAKDLVYKEDFKTLGNQLMLLAEQKNRHRVLEGVVNFTITDSPFLMGLTYLSEDKHIPQKEFIDLTLAMYKTFNTLNIFLKRNNEEHPYQEYGRSQNLSEAEAKDVEIKLLLEKNNIPFIELEIGNSLIPELLYEINKRR